MLEILENCFPNHIEEWEPKLKEMIPSYGKVLMDHPQLLEEVHATTARALNLDNGESKEQEDEQTVIG